jgi:hypothetical protein
MKKLQILRITAATVLGVGFSAGVASATTGTISGPTGPNSNNQVTFNGWDTRTVSNDNRVNVRNTNPQHADTGRAEVEHNTTGGNATSGDATNDSLLRANLSINNAGSSAAAMNTGDGDQTGSITGATGPSSNNQVTFNGGTTVTVDNNNCIDVSNYNHQSADSGSAEVSGNTTGGSATSGDATNISTTEVIVSVTN